MISAVESWKRMVSHEFEFAVKCNKIVTHERTAVQPNEKMLEAFLGHYNNLQDPSS